MGENKIQRWEKMLGIIPYNSSIEERRTRIQAKVLEKLPYFCFNVCEAINCYCEHSEQ